MDVKLLKDKIKRDIQNESLSHAYIIESKEPDAAGDLAFLWAKGALCSSFSPAQPELGACGHCPSCHQMDSGNHPNFFLLSEEGANIKDEAAEAMQIWLSKKPMGGGKQIAVIEGAERLTPRAQNRLLKTLEEPRGDALLLLLCANRDMLLDTVRSRCVILHPGKEDRVGEKELTPEDLALAEQFCGLFLEKAPFYRLLAECGDMPKDRARSLAFLEALELEYRKHLLSSYPGTESLLAGVTKALGSDNGASFSPAAGAAAPGIDGAGGRIAARSLDHEQIEMLKKGIHYIERAKNGIGRGLSPAYSVKRLFLQLGE